MSISIMDYHPIIHKEIDEWIDEHKFTNAKLINKFATYHKKISSQHHYFLEHPYDMANIKSFIKVFEVKGTVVSVVAFHYYVENEIYNLSINPLIVHPEKMNQGFGYQTLKLIVENPYDIVEGKVDNVKALVKIDNIVSIKIFEKIGFKKEKTDEGFIDYTYQIKQY